MMAYCFCGLVFLNMLINFSVHGNWGKWFEWSACSQSCGGGVRTRARECNNPTPLYGGRSCEGNITEVESCNNNECPGEIFGWWKYRRNSASVG